MDEKFVLGVIPARGGSKGIKDKNIVDLGGKPLIAYSIESALKSKFLSDVIVSTDSEKIAGLSKKLGVTVPFMRPAELAGDKTTMLLVLKNVINEYEAFSGKRVDVIVWLQPTSPFRTAWHIDKSVELILCGKADSVFSVTELEVESDWVMQIENGLLKRDSKSDFSLRRQEFGKHYKMHGLIKVFSREVVMEAKNYPWGKKPAPLKTGKRVAFEIDEPEDLDIARALIVGIEGESK